MDKKGKASYVKDVFADIANKYDRMNLIMTFGMVPIWQKKVMNSVALKPGERGLDVCCGTGEMTLQMGKRVGPFGGAVGLDFSAEMLEVAKDKLDEKSRRMVTFVQGDAMNLPFQDNLFDGATNGFALRNVSDILKCLSEMARVVRPGGKVVCLDVSRPSFPPSRLFFNFYYYRFVPWIGKKSGSRNAIDGQYEPYTWLAESLRNFPSRKGIKRLYEQAGMVNVKVKPMGFGAVTMYIGEVPLPEGFHPKEELSTEEKARRKIMKFNLMKIKMRHQFVRLRFFVKKINSKKK